MKMMKYLLPDRSLLWCISLVWLLWQNAAAQDASKVIDIKQRLLRPKSFSDDIKQETDSMRTLHLMIGGNIYQTEKHANYCYDEAKGQYNFREELKYIQPILGLGDLAIANLKTAFANDENNMFTSPDEFALALKYSGINVLAHANAHTAQIDKATLKRTRDMLYDYEMLHTGAFTDGMQRNGNFPLIINKKGFRIALLNYTTLNARPGISRDFIINEIDKTYIERDMRVARINKPDFIIVYFDWGTNNQDIPSSYQTDLAQYCFNLGANLVVGTLPNTPLRLDYMTYSQYGQLKEGIVAYSLGNLIASNDEVRNRNGYVIDMELKKNNFTGETNVGDWGVIPVYTYYDTSTVKGKTNVLSLPCSAVENGDILTKIPYIEKRRVINGAYEVRKLLGATADEIQYNMTELTANNVMETIDLTKSALNNRFNQKKASDIAPSAAPVLPIATVGSNNPPSLAQIFGEAKPAGITTGGNALIVKNETPKPSAIVAEKNKAESLFIENAAPIASAKVSSSNPSKTDIVKVAPTETAVVANINPTTSSYKTTVTPAEQKIEVASTPSAKTDTAKIAPIAEVAVPTINSIVNGNKTSSMQAEQKAVVVSTPTLKTDISASANKTESVANASKTAIENTSVNTEIAKTTVNEETQKETTKTEKVVEETAKKPAKAAVVLSDDEAKKKREATPLTDDAPRSKRAPQALIDDPAKKKTVETIVFTDEVKKPKPAAPVFTENKTEAKSQNATSLNKVSEPQLKFDMSRVSEKSVSITVDTFYRVQIYALQKFIPLDTNYYTHLKGYEVVEEGGLFKYLIGKYRLKEQCERFWKDQILPRYKTSFVVQYIDGKRKFE
jgi:poly-gamma-glutamate capsule biosynthesis protein CapA/YwtB (metallophosphatase superfamily)